MNENLSNIIKTLTLATNSKSESTRVRASLGLIKAENIVLQRERINERKERYCLLYPAKLSE